MLTHKGTKTIETARLILRQPQHSDAAPMYRNWANNPEVVKYLTWPVHSSPEVSAMIVDTWVEGCRKENFYHWMIVPKDIGEPIGSISGVKQNEAVQSVEIGYCIGESWWHQGLVTEAMQALIAFFFQEVGMNRIEACHDVNNPHSGGVMRKCGMHYEGTSLQSARNNQGICDMAHYAILRSQWNRPKPTAEDFRVEDDAELVEELYSSNEEKNRLHSQSGRVEFLTTVRYIEKYLTPGAKILDIGAGAGEYSLHFVRQGYDVSALELASANVEAFRQQMQKPNEVELVQGNALDLSRYKDESFDVVLLLGPLYHLHSRQDKEQCLEEAKRVCKKDGKLFVGFISNDIVILTMQQVMDDYLLNGYYDKETFKLINYPFVFHTVDDCRALLKAGGLSILHEVAADGLSELLKDMVNHLDERSYKQYLRYHQYLCEKPECLGLSNHLLFVCDK